MAAVIVTLGVTVWLSTTVIARLLEWRELTRNARTASAVVALQANAAQQYAERPDSIRRREVLLYGRALEASLARMDSVSGRTPRVAELIAATRTTNAQFRTRAITPALAGAPFDAPARATQRALIADFGRIVQFGDTSFAQTQRRQRSTLLGGIGIALIELITVMIILWRFRRHAIEDQAMLLDQTARLQEQQVELETQTEEAQVMAEELEQANEELVEAMKIADAARDRSLSAARESAANLALLDAALASAPVGIGFYDESLRYQRVNARLAEIIGLPGHELIGRRLRDVLPAFADRLEPVMREVQETGQPVVDTVVRGTTLADAGGDREFLITYYPLHSTGSLPGVGVVVTEMTHQRHLEAQLRQSQKMDAIGRLAGGVAHDFNNLLTVIIAHAGMAREGLGPASQSELGEDLGQIEEAARRAATLTHQLLAFSRQQVLQPSLLDLNESVRNLERMLRRLIGEDIEFITDLDPKLYSIWADAGQIDQILMNLVVNARDAMPNGGELRLTAQNGLPRSNGRQAPPGGADVVILEVKDTGSGMDAETVQHIFEPFFTTKENGKGTGLGLSTVYGIVEQSGGHISVESAPGAGTTFRLEFPSVRSPDRVDAHVDAAIRVSHGSETILVVEDENGVRQLMERVLTRKGYHVHVAADGNQARRFAASAPGLIDLLVTDMVMPGMTGREVSDAVRIEHPGVKVLFMSGYTEDDIIRRGLDQPHHAFLQKPFTAAGLLEKVRDVLDNSVTRNGEVRAARS